MSVKWSIPTRRFCIHGPFNNHLRITRQRVARWNVEREGRETKAQPPTSVLPVCTGDFGTNARHPPRKRYSHAQRRHVRADTAVRPYAEDLFAPSHRRFRNPTSRHHSLQQRRHVRADTAALPYAETLDSQPLRLQGQLIPNDTHIFAIDIRAATRLGPTDVRTLVWRKA